MNIFQTPEEQDETAAPAAPPETAETAGDDIVTVRQTTLEPGVEAQHETRTGKFYTLRSDVGCEIPLEDAYTFLSIDAFEVRDVNGDIVRPVSDNKVEEGRVVLADDEVIAKLDELTNQSLLKRCKLHKASEGLHKSTKKDDLIAFLVAIDKEVTFGISRGSDDVAPEMSAALLDSLGVNPMDRLDA